MKSLLLALLLGFFTSTFVQAEEAGYCEGCLTGLGLPVNQKDLQKIAENAFNCEDQYAKEAQELYQSSFPDSATRSSEKFDNLKLTGTKEELKAMRKMLGKQPPKEWSRMAKECSTVVCALSKIFKSEESAQRSLAFYKKTGYVFSIDQDSNPKGVEHVWSKEDIRTVDRAYRRLPEQFFNLPTLDIISRVPPGYRSVKNESTAAWARPRIVVSGTVYAPGEIRTYDTGVASDDVRFRFETMIHELAHHYDFTYEKKYGRPISETTEFSSISGWKKSKKTKKTKTGVEVEEEHSHAQGHAFVRDYAGTTPTEDFAEAVAYYVMDGPYLRDLDPKKYAYIKAKIFNGVEFKDLPDGIKSLSDLEVLHNCADQITSVEPNYLGLEIKLNGQKSISRSTEAYRFGADDSLKSMNCLPEVNLQQGGLQLCDLGKTKNIAATTYAPVFKKMGHMLDYLMNESNFTETRKECWNNKDFTNQCPLKSLKLSGLSEDEKNIFFEKIVPKWNGESKYSARGSSRDLSPYLPMQKLNLACMADSFEKITVYNDNAIIYRPKNTEKDNWYMYSKNTDISCSDNAVAQVLDSSYKFDQRSAAVTEQLKKDSQRDAQNKIVDGLVKIAAQCKKSFNRGYSKSCIQEKLANDKEHFVGYDEQDKILLAQLVEKFD